MFVDEGTNIHNIEPTTMQRVQCHDHVAMVKTNVSWPGQIITWQQNSWKVTINNLHPQLFASKIRLLALGCLTDSVLTTTINGLLDLPNLCPTPKPVLQLRSVEGGQIPSTNILHCHIYCGFSKTPSECRPCSEFGGLNPGFFVFAENDKSEYYIAKNFLGAGDANICPSMKSALGWLWKHFLFCNHQLVDEIQTFAWKPETYYSFRKSGYYLLSSKTSTKPRIQKWCPSKQPKKLGALRIENSEFVETTRNNKCLQFMVYGVSTVEFKIACVWP